MIVYYSGTGNSKYVADMLADILGDETFCATEYIKNEIAAEISSEKPWVFVAPVYVSAPPLVFEDFVRRAKLSGCKKAWFIMTCAGGMGASPAYWEAMCKEKELDYMGTVQVVMPQNYLVFFSTNDKEKSAEIIKAAKPVIAELAGSIKAEEPFDCKPAKGWELVSTKMILKPYYKWFIKAKAFYANDDCISCGLCAKKCPLGNVSLTDGKPVWGDRCTHCMACINYCPKQAVEYGKKSIGKPRYHAPEYVK